ncbi:MAG: redox-regulated ATPase YchF [Candidatus Gribaldobacteria bacterium]|nr:redox-regulated ATPase YchF [Candidatus Gribaldobacteria bacterium]
MKLSIGIVGLPNVGKSTLFQTITKKEVPRENYPFCTIDPNVGVVAVPDERVERLAELTRSAKKIYATIDFVDIAGLVKGASQGEGLGNQFLAHIRETNAIIYVLRAFANENIINTQETIDILRDKEILDTELILKDLDTIEKRLVSSEKEAKIGKKEAIKEVAVLQKAKELLDKGIVLSESNLIDEEKEILKNTCLLTLKNRLYLFNGAENDISAEVKNTFEKNNWPYLVLDILTEFEAVDMTEDERLSFGLPIESGLKTLIKKCYEILGLLTFLTTGPDETRAWTIKKGDKAPQAGGAIHSDFEELFIKAEVINWQDLLNSGGFARAREKGLIRTEGKEYIVQDGDVIEIKSGR